MRALRMEYVRPFRPYGFVVVRIGFYPVVGSRYSAFCVFVLKMPVMIHALDSVVYYFIPYPVLTTDIIILNIVDYPLFRKNHTVGDVFPNVQILIFLRVLPRGYNI